MTPAAALDGPEEAAVFWWDHLDEAQAGALELMRAAAAAAAAARNGDDRDGDGNGGAASAALRALPPSLQTDLALLRFLKARAWDVEKAMAMYLEMAGWRQRERPGDDDDGGDDENDAATTAARHRASLKRHYPSFLHHTDRYGRPVAYRLLGQSDADALLRAMSVKQFLRLHLAANERFRERVLPACSRAAGRPIIAGTVVLDMEGFSLTKHFSPAVRAVVPLLSAVDQANFPEHLGSMVIVNCPALFRSAWLAVRPFLDERTLRKISVVGPGEASREALLALIPRERLPVAYGGTSCVRWEGGDGGEGGGGWADAGPWVEEEEEEEQEAAVGGQGGNEDAEREAMLLLGLGGSNGGTTSINNNSSSSAGGVARLLLRRRSSVAAAATAPPPSPSPPAPFPPATDDPPSRHRLTVAIARRKSTPLDTATTPSTFCTPVGSSRPSSFDDAEDDDDDDDNAPPPLQRSGSLVRLVLGAAIWHARARRASAALERQGSSSSGSGSLLRVVALVKARRQQRHAHAE